jgi:hypothetical protein
MDETVAEVVNEQPLILTLPEIDVLRMENTALKEYNEKLRAELSNLNINLEKDRVFKLITNNHGIDVDKYDVQYQVPNKLILIPKK